VRTVFPEQDAALLAAVKASVEILIHHQEF
jgi:hypothetical protein